MKIKSSGQECSVSLEQIAEMLGLDPTCLVKKASKSGEPFGRETYAVSAPTGTNLINRICEA